MFDSSKEGVKITLVAWFRQHKLVFLEKSDFFTHYQKSYEPKSNIQMVSGT